MKSESKFDPKLIEEMIKFGKNIINAPKLVSAPDEISLEVTPHDIVQEIDKTRLLHYRSLTEKQYKTPLLISYALINRYHPSNGKQTTGIDLNRSYARICFKFKENLNGVNTD